MVKVHFWSSTGELVKATVNIRRENAHSFVSWLNRTGFHACIVGRLGNPAIAPVSKRYRGGNGVV